MLTTFIDQPDENWDKCTQTERQQGHLCGLDEAAGSGRGRVGKERDWHTSVKSRSSRYLRMYRMIWLRILKMSLGRGFTIMSRYLCLNLVSCRSHQIMRKISSTSIEHPIPCQSHSYSSLTDAQHAMLSAWQLLLREVTLTAGDGISDHAATGLVHLSLMRMSKVSFATQSFFDDLRLQHKRCS